MKWYKLTDPEVIQFESDQMIQQSCCEVSGEVYIRPIVGKYKDLPTRVIRDIIARVTDTLRQNGHPIMLDFTIPLWATAEFVENLYDFEVNPPCGCESKLDISA